MDKKANMWLWDEVKQPPENMLRIINGGRLKGFTDINPQWRLQVLTEQFGICGIGWKYRIERTWLESGANDEVVAFAQVELFIKVNNEWSDPIPGIGGSMLIQAENRYDGKTGEVTGRSLRSNDEAYKMAVTDAISVAAKALGIGADVYMGRMDNPEPANDKLTPPRKKMFLAKVEELKQKTPKEEYQKLVNVMGAPESLMSVSEAEQFYKCLMAAAENYKKSMLKMG